MTVEELAAYIDQSVLKPEFTQAEIRKYIQEGIDFGCRTVCINPSSLDIAAELARGLRLRFVSYVISRSAYPQLPANACRLRNTASAGIFLNWIS